MNNKQTKLKKIKLCCIWHDDTISVLDENIFCSKHIKKTNRGLEISLSYNSGKENTVLSSLQPF